MNKVLKVLKLLRPPAILWNIFDGMAQQLELSDYGAVH
jgi:hypothetical protein